MKYILDERYRLRGWQGAPTGLFDTKRKAPAFLERLAKNGALFTVKPVMEAFGRISSRIGSPPVRMSFRSSTMMTLGDSSLSAAADKSVLTSTPRQSAIREIFLRSRKG